MLHLNIQVPNSDNLTEIDVDPNDTIVSILNFIENPKKTWQTNSKIHFIYNEKVLSHYLSFSFHQIKNNSLINVVVIDQHPHLNRAFRQKPNHFISISGQARQRFIKLDRTDNSIDNELLRLSDLSFLHFELSSSFYSSSQNIQDFLQCQNANQISMRNSIQHKSTTFDIDKILISNNMAFKLNRPPITKPKSISEDPLPPCFDFSFL